MSVWTLEPEHINIFLHGQRFSQDTLQDPPPGPSLIHDACTRFQMLCSMLFTTGNTAALIYTSSPSRLELHLIMLICLSHCISSGGDPERDSSLRSRSPCTADCTMSASFVSFIWALFMIRHGLERKEHKGSQLVPLVACSRQYIHHWAGNRQRDAFFECQLNVSGWTYDTRLHICRHRTRKQLLLCIINSNTLTTIHEMCVCLARSALKRTLAKAGTVIYMASAIVFQMRHYILYSSTTQMSMLMF